MSFKEVHQHFADAEALKAEGAEINRQNRYQLHKQTQPMVAAAKKRMEAATKGVSRSSRRKDTAPARAQELQKERAELGGVRKDSSPDCAEQFAEKHAGESRGHNSNVVPISREIREEQLGHEAPLGGDARDVLAAPRPKTLAERMAEFRKIL
ncbi:hypothetical protein [Acidovorax sp.]|uniref:hypothetical protein n=1 Tax=Acidovorax sp. TaxID=1872122 RepID=UPI00391F4F68